MLEKEEKKYIEKRYFPLGSDGFSFFLFPLRFLFISYQGPGKGRSAKLQNYGKGFFDARLFLKKLTGFNKQL